MENGRLSCSVRLQPNSGSGGGLFDITYVYKTVGEGTSAGDTPVACVESQPRRVPWAERFLRPAKPVLYTAISVVLGITCEQASAAQASSVDDHEEIIVTAQRRPERAEDVPISLTALSGEELQRMQATDMAGLGKVVPSLNMTRTGAFTQPYLRGVGKRSTLGVENSVATYVDGVYLASPISALLDLRGIERIEVLNGPQGTLFGRNATGGVIQVITRDPSPDTSGEGELHGGNYGYVRGDAYLTGGSDRIAGNLALSLSRNGGYGTNFFTGKKDQGEVDHSLVARSKWVWRPTSSLKLTFAGDYQDIDQDFSSRPVAGFAPIGEPRISGFRDGDQDSSNRFRFRYGGVSIQAHAEIGGVSFMSLSAVRRARARFGFDLDLGPRPLFSGAPTAEQRQISQEFQLQSSEASRLRWLAGLYYIRIGEKYDPTLFGYGGSYSALLGGRIRQTLSDSGTASSYAAYGQGTLPIGRASELTLGLRYTIEHRSVEANGERLFDNSPLVRPIPGLPLLREEPFRNSEAFPELTWRASLDRHFSDEVMGYLAVSRGFQSGGWNLQTPQNPAFGPERLDDFEAGLKFVDRSRRFRADTNVFYYDYSDLQVSAATPIGSVTTNATSAEIYGIELQLDARLGENTDLTLGAQLMKARFKRFPNAICTDFTAGAVVPYSPITCDVTGNHLPFAPKLKFNAGANRQISLGGNGTLVLSANLAYNSGYFSEPDNVVRQKAFTTVDASAEWRMKSSGTSVRFWMLNLTDSHYYNSLVTFPTAGVLQSPSPPRRVGASVAYSF
jgi:iron complex outermembrane recepter protein